MKILVMSDSHGRRDLVEKCIRSNSQAEVVLHLGDYTGDFADMRFTFPDRMFINVRGNGDFDRGIPQARVEAFDGVKIFMAHGHTYGVKYGLDAIMTAARKEGAQICLYGHTHESYNKYHDGLYVMNPGSLAYPRGMSRASYGLIEICPQGIVTNIVEFKNMW
ncbi:MAG: metallophosphoesterase [Firmicutes bacterium]|nr:metallophosphoesterase [Bacillota bacterium]